MTATLQDVIDFLDRNYGEAGIVAEATDGPAIAVLTFPTEFADVGGLGAALKTEVGVVCDLVASSGDTKFYLWAIPEIRDDCAKKHTSFVPSCTLQYVRWVCIALLICFAGVYAYFFATRR
jgi:hypothetical protein